MGISPQPADQGFGRGLAYANSQNPALGANTQQTYSGQPLSATAPAPTPAPQGTPAPGIHGLNTLGGATASPQSNIQHANMNGTPATPGQVGTPTSNPNMFSGGEFSTRATAPQNPAFPQGPQASPQGVPLGGSQGGSQGGNQPLASNGYGSLMQGFNQQFQAPTAATEQNDPGYQFRLNQGMQALQNSAAARGGLLSGNTGQALEDFAQNDASNEYGNVYNRALGQYQQNYNIYNQNQANQFNRLAALSGVGQTAAGQLNSAGASANQAAQQAAGNVGNISMTAGQQIGQQMNNAGAATASGYVGQANALGGALQGATGSLGNSLLLSQLLGSSGGGASNNTSNLYNPMGAEY